MCCAVFFFYNLIRKLHSVLRNNVQERADNDDEVIENAQNLSNICVNI